MMSVEELIKYKAYHELSVEELDLLKDMATNEVEFDQLKQFIGQTELHFKDKKIEASDSMQAQFLSELYPISHQKSSWWLPFFSFFFPSDKSWYQYPAIQFSGLVLILFGLFNLFETPIKKQELAVHTKIEKLDENNGLIIKNKDSISDIQANKNEVKQYPNAPEESSLDLEEVNTRGKYKLEPTPTPPPVSNSVTAPPKISLNEQHLDMMEDDLKDDSKSLVDKDHEIVLEEVTESLAPSTDFTAVTSTKAGKTQLTETYNNTNLEGVVIETSKKKRDRLQKESKVQSIIFKVKDILGLSELFYEVK